MQQREVYPEELIEMFVDEFDHQWPLGGVPGPDNTDYDSYWSVYVSKGVGILKCSLRDVYGNEADFEWELRQKTL